MTTGGFAEITATGVSVLAEKSFHRTETTRDHMDKLVADATVAFEAAKASGNGVDDAELVLHHISEMARIHVD